MPPQIMVMGDSLGQGCRNLSVTSLNCSQCYAAIIAQQLGWQLRTPKYPQPVLFDLLNDISQLDVDLPLVFVDLLSEIDDNIAYWNSSAWMQPAGTVHDNIAITGATYADLFTNTAQTYRNQIASLAPKGALNLLTSKIPGQTLSDLHLAITGMYALNPEGDNAIDPNAGGYTAFDIIKNRRPQNLFVDIGHNGTDSYFFASGGDAVPLQNPAPDYGFDPNLYVPTMSRVIDNLASLNSAGGSPIKIYLSLLPKISAVANLTPSGNLNNGYYDVYEPTLSVSTYTLTAAQAAALDQAVSAANNQIRAYAAAKDPANIVIVDYYALFSAIDYKNAPQGPGDGGKQIVAGPNTIDNRYVTGEDVFHPIPDSSKQPRGYWTCTFEEGGFQSIDGMHPSAVGYAYVALQILTQHMGQNVAPATAASILQQAFNGDPLLSQFPINLSSVIDTLKVVRRAGGSSDVIDGTDIPVAVATQILNGNNSSIARDYVTSVVRQSKQP